MKQTLEQLKRIVLELKQYFEKSLPLILIGVALGYTFAQHLEAQTPKDIGFATVEDMSFLVQELKDCRDNAGTLDGSYQMILGKGDMIDLVLTIAIVGMAIGISVGIETLFDWYIKY